MTNAAFYRAEAKRYRERAAAAKDTAEAEQLLRFAEEQETLAALLDGSDDQQPAPEPRSGS